jgi:hypothetical protein
LANFAFKVTKVGEVIKWAGADVLLGSALGPGSRESRAIVELGCVIAATSADTVDVIKDLLAGVGIAFDDVFFGEHSAVVETFNTERARCTRHAAVLGAGDFTVAVHNGVSVLLEEKPVLVAVADTVIDLKEVVHLAASAVIGEMATIRHTGWAVEKLVVGSLIAGSRHDQGFNFNLYMIRIYLLYM